MQTTELNHNLNLDNITVVEDLPGGGLIITILFSEILFIKIIFSDDKFNNEIILLLLLTPILSD